MLVRVKNLLSFAVCLTVSEIKANLHFGGHLTLRGSCDIKNKIFKNCNFVGSYPSGIENSLRFAISFTVSEIKANLHFRGHLTLRGHVTSKLKFCKQ